MRRLLLGSVAAATLPACGSGISGEYSGGDCVWEKLSCKSNDTVYVTMMGSETSLQYKVDEDRVSISPPGQPGVVFREKGETLEADGGKVTCKKL
jgi:hypothetical protein